jgi:hypothetical protein
METPTDLTLPEPGTAWAEFDEDSPLPPRKPKAFTRTSLVLTFVLVLGVGFAVGARVQKSQAPAVAASPLTATRAARTGTGTGATTGTGSGSGAGFGAGAGASGGAGGAGGAGGGGNTVGSVKLVDGGSVYIQTTAGDVIKVTPGAGASVLVSKAGTVADFKPGDTIIVQGTADADGNIAATSIASTNGLSLRGGGGGGGTGTTGSTTTTTKG